MPTIIVRCYELNLQDRYAAGHQLTEQEAKSLNNLRAVFLRDIFSKKVPRPEDGLLSPEELESLQLELNEYAMSYSVPPQREKPFVSTLQQSLREVAQERVEQLLREKKKDKITLADFKGLIHNELHSKEVQEEGRRRFLAKRTVAQDFVSGLL